MQTTTVRAVLRDERGIAVVVGLIALPTRAARRSGRAVEDYPGKAGRLAALREQLHQRVEERRPRHDGQLSGNWKGP